MKFNDSLTPELSVIIPQSPEAELTYEWAEEQLKGIPHETIVVPRWSYGIKQAHSEYVCLLEKDCVLGDRYFNILMAQFMDRPSYRKLAMVCPSVGVNSYTNRVFGYRVAFRNATPVTTPSSSLPYHAQIGYIPGAIIRKSALPPIAPRPSTILADSASLSLHLWATGQRIIMVPNALYISTAEELDSPFWYKRKDNNLSVINMFQREAIG